MTTHTSPNPKTDRGTDPSTDLRDPLLGWLDAPERSAELAAAGDAATGYTALLAHTVADLDARFAHFHWTGIYLLEPGSGEAGDMLVLGPFVGEPTEHVRIPVGRGICGAAVAERDTIVVDDVRADPRYLACFVATRSEIVVPIITAAGRVVGEIDIDSEDPAAFGEGDRRLLEAVAERLARLAPPEVGA